MFKKNRESPTPLIKHCSDIYFGIYSEIQPSANASQSGEEDGQVRHISARLMAEEPMRHCKFAFNLRFNFRIGISKTISFFLSVQHYLSATVHQTGGPTSNSSVIFGPAGSLK